VLTPAVELALIIALLYVAELCARSAPPRRFFVEGAWRDGRLRRPGFVVRSALPWRTAYEVGGFHVHAGARGVYAYQPHRLSTNRPVGWGHRYVGYDALPRLVQHGVDLTWDGRLFLQLPAPHLAASLHAWLVRVATATPQARGALVGEAFARALDEGAVAARHHEVRCGTRLLRAVQTLFVAYLAAAVVQLARGAWLGGTWQVTLAATVACDLAVVAAFVLAHRRLVPGALDERMQHAVAMVLAFPAACRACDVVARHALAEFHFLAVARALGDERALREAARHELTLLRRPSARGWLPDDGAAREALDEAREQAYERLARYVKTAGIDVAALLAAPAARSGDAGVIVCPSCHSEYVAGTVRCAGCEIDLAS
jgi:hypothetical protein